MSIACAGKWMYGMVMVLNELVNGWRAREWMESIVMVLNFWHCSYLCLSTSTREES